MTTPNILWISTHDINPHVGPYAGLWPDADQTPTPRIDALAREGVRFDQAFAAAPVCAPSRSAIMTGCYPTAIGTMHMRTKSVPPPEVRLLSEYFREAGYYTTNNWFTDFQVETPPTAFDDCSTTAHWRDRPEGAPFFASFHSLLTHESRIYGDDAYAQATVGLADSDRHDPGVVPLPPYHPDTPAFRRAWARYFDLIAAMDIWVGRIIDELDGAGLAEDTLVVFWSDHGASFPRAKRWASEAGVRVPLIARWPGRIPAGTARTEVVQLLDLAPTMLRAAGIDIPRHMHGRPLISETGDPLPSARYAYAGRDRMDAQEDTVRTIRDERYRYTQNLHPDRSSMQYNYYPDHVGTWNELRRLGHMEGEMLAVGRTPDILTALQRSLMQVPRPVEELYDIAEDPHETRNLAEDPDHRSRSGDCAKNSSGGATSSATSVSSPNGELLEQWRPGGRARTTAAPTVTVHSGVVTAKCATEGDRSDGPPIRRLRLGNGRRSSGCRAHRCRTGAGGTCTQALSPRPTRARSGSERGASATRRARKCSSRRPGATTDAATRSRRAADHARDHAHVRQPQPPHAAAIRRTCVARAQLRAARGAGGHLRQLLRRDRCRACRRAGSCTPVATTSCTAAGARSSRSTTRCPRCCAAPGVHTHLASDHCTTGRTAARPITPAIRQLGVLPRPGGRPVEGRRGRHPSDPREGVTSAWRGRPPGRINRQYMADRGRALPDAHRRRRARVPGDQRRLRTVVAADRAVRPARAVLQLRRATKTRYLHHYDGRSSTGPATGRVARATSRCRAHPRRVPGAADHVRPLAGPGAGRMDEHDLWDDTMLIVNTDHGFLLGERGWWAKSVHALVQRAGPGCRCSSGTRAPAAAATRATAPGADHRPRPDPARFFGLDADPGHAGRDLAGASRTDAGARGRAVRRLRRSRQRHRRPLRLHAGARRLPPTPRSRSTPSCPRTCAAGSASASCRDGSRPSRSPSPRDVRMMRMPAASWWQPLAARHAAVRPGRPTPASEHPLADDDLELRMLRLLVDLMRRQRSAREPVRAAGAPVRGESDNEHLLVRAQAERAAGVAEPIPREHELAARDVLTRPVDELLTDARFADIVRRHAPEFPALRWWVFPAGGVCLRLRRAPGSTPRPCAR